METDSATVVSQKSKKLLREMLRWLKNRSLTSLKLRYTDLDMSTAS